MRGQTTGWAASAAGFATVLISLVLIILPQRNSAALLLFFVGLAAVSWWLAAALFTRLDEEKQDEQQKSSSSIRERLNLLRKQPAFRRFVVARSFLVSTALVAPWYVMLSVSSTTIISSVGALMLASGLASFVSAPVWGRYSDRSSRWVLQTSAMCVAAIGGLTVLLYFAFPFLLDSFWLIPGLYFLLEIAHQGVRVGRKTYVVDIANNANRADYVSLSNTLIGIIILVIGFVSGIIAIWLSSISMIVVFSIAAAIGAWLASSLQEALEEN